MRLAAWHRAKGDEVHFSRSPYRQADEPAAYDRVYGSALFSFSAKRVARLEEAFPGAIIGGTGTGSQLAVEELEGFSDVGLDYSPWPTFDGSLGFTQRGCRFKCGFCAVPSKEGKAHATASIADIWRGAPYPRHLHLLDNDFFGQPREQWQARIEEIREGRFKVCFNQGVNVRVISEEAAAALASVQYRDDGFRVRRLYTAWDNLGDERIFFRGIDRLEAAGIPASNVMAYMLVGYDPAETWEAIDHRFRRMVARGIMPFPMVFDRARRDLKAFQRWVLTGLYRTIPFEAYCRAPVTHLARFWQRAPQHMAEEIV